MTPAALICLAQAIYYEARGEPIFGQFAVAEVVLNRVDDPMYADTVCGVVAEDWGPEPWDCQFSYMCDGKVEDMADDLRARNLAMMIARMTAERKTDFASGALLYHTADVKPGWSEDLPVVAVIGDHIFYAGSTK